MLSTPELRAQFLIHAQEDGLAIKVKLEQSDRIKIDLPAHDTAAGFEKTFLDRKCQRQAVVRRYAGHAGLQNLLMAVDYGSQYGVTRCCIDHLFDVDPDAIVGTPVGITLHSQNRFSRLTRSHPLPG